MVAVKTADIRNDFKAISEMVNSGESVLISRPHNQNLVVISEKLYNELERIRHNAEYLTKLDESHRQILEGRIVHKTMDELEAIAR